MTRPEAGRGGDDHSDTARSADWAWPSPEHSPARSFLTNEAVNSFAPPAPMKRPFIASIARPLPPRRL
jgi:hypothetical protein